MRALPALLVLGFFAACGDSTSGPSATPPAAPLENDPSFTVAGLRGWYLIGNAATPGHDTLAVAVTAPAGTSTVDVWVADMAGQRLEQAGGEFHGEVDLTGVAPGQHDILLAADGSDTAFARLSFRRSHPYYVLMTTDWDFSDPTDVALEAQDEMHAQHPHMKLTHFVAPYTFTDPDVTTTRANQLVAWVIQQRDTFGDEIGLHIHPYCHFVEYAGLDCITSNSTVYRFGDPSGYTTKCSAYTEDQFATLVAAADQLFLEHGLGKPTTFRAGGWTASLEVLRALESQGYVADTSAANWMKLEEWEGYEMYRWNMENWLTIGDTSQPYYPSQDDILASDSPTLGILEVPDNGIMVDYVTVEEELALFAANWNGEALSVPTTLMMGFHPSEYWSTDEGQRIDAILDHSDQFLALDDQGPVVYTTLDQMPRVFTR
jgi:hypothetical protein